MTTDRVGLVLEGTGGIWRVKLDTGEAVDAAMRGRLKRTYSGEGEEPLKLAVGDRVRIEGDEGQTLSIAEIFPRRSKLARRAPGGGYGERVLAANVDQVVVVFAAAKPEPHRRMLDRFLVIVEANGLAAQIVLNKVDLVDLTGVRSRFSDYERAGYPVHYVSVKQRVGLEGLRAVLDHRISVLTGPSGVGKSSMLNALFPGLNLRVGEISESVNKGRHTTVGSLMVPLPGVSDGYVVDTPGLREVGMWALPETALDDCFREFRSHLDACRFGDCRHTVEPDCGVRSALARGEISAERYDSYVTLLEELSA